MQLHYLDFDFSDEESGHGSFDAMATVKPERLPALLQEITAVLQWAFEAFGPISTLHDAHEWDFELQASTESGEPIQAEVDLATGHLTVPAAAGMDLSTWTLTLSGSPGFCDAFLRAFQAAH